MANHSATAAPKGPALDWWLAPVSGAPVVTETPTLLSATKQSSTNSTDASAGDSKPTAHCGSCETAPTSSSSSSSSSSVPPTGSSIAATAAALGIATGSSGGSGSDAKSAPGKTRKAAKSLSVGAKLKAAAGSSGGGDAAPASATLTAADDGSKSLAVVYHEAQRVHRALDSLSGDDKQKQLQTAFLGFLKVEKMVADAALISANEELDDVATADLKYVLVDFYLGDLLMAMGGADQRLARVKRAVAYLKKFLNACSALKALPKDETATFKRYLSGARATPQVLREEKIAAHKRESAVAAKLDALLKAREELRRAGKLDDALAEHDDDEREYTLTLLAHCQLLALRHLLMSGQELDILEHMARQAAHAAATHAHKAGGAPSSSAGAGAGSAGPSGGAGAGGAAGPKKKPEVYKITSAQQLGSLPPSLAQHINFRAADGSLHAVSELNAIQTAINRASHARDMVFRDPNPATMDLDTFVAREMANGGILPAQKPPEKSEEDVAAEEDDNEEVNDKKTLKQRKWDDWTDEHEKGAGNKMK